MAPSLWQLLIVLLIVVLVFGSKRLRGLGSDLGSAFRGFKKEVANDDKKNDKDDAEKLEQAPKDKPSSESTEGEKSDPQQKSEKRD